MRSRSGTRVLIALLLAVLRVAEAQAAEPVAANASPGAAATEAARAHFKTGVKLYQDANYTGALTEFETAYSLKPGPGSLQNVALCQKALFRYGEAVDSLTRLLTHHDAELSDAERTAAKRARDELDALVGTVRLVVSPPGADVTIDGQPLTLIARGAPLRLNVGEHALGATAPGYARTTTTLRVASGQREVTVELTLTPDPTPERGTLPVVGAEPRATAPLTPASAAVAPPEKRAVGWYGAGAVSLLGTGDTPFRYDLAKAKQNAWGLGLHVGRRIRPAVAVEGLLEYDVLKVRGACDHQAGEQASEQVLCGDPGEIIANYLVRSLRFGPTLGLMTTDPRFRALGGLGLGLVWHELRVGLDKGHSVNPYLLLEVGIGANTKHVLFALAAELLVDGARGIGHRGDEAAFARSDRSLLFAGLNLRVGYSEWAP